MLARRAEALTMEHGPPHAAFDALGHSSVANRLDANHLEHMATLLSGFAELRVYNPRLLEVVQCCLEPSVVAATHHLPEIAASSGRTKCSAGPINSLLSEHALAKYCWSVGRLGPALPELHKTLGTLACAAVSQVQDMETLARISWWSAVMQGLDSSVLVKSTSSQVDAAAAGPIPAAVMQRLAQLVCSRDKHERPSARENYRHAMWNASTSNVLWGLACHEWHSVDYVDTFWAAVRPAAQADARRRSTATLCRLHQCLIEIETNAACEWEPESNWQAEIAASCHQTFVDSARKTIRQRTRSTSAFAGDTMQERVGHMLRRATGSRVESEVILPSGYTVDLYVHSGSQTEASQQPKGRPIAVEVEFPLLPSHIP